jgi:hypothetical protein
MHGSFKYIQTYRDKVIMNGGIANQWPERRELERRKNIVRSSLEESAFLPMLEPCCRSTLLVRNHDFRSIEHDLSPAFHFSLDYPIQKMRMQIVS